MSNRFIEQLRRLRDALAEADAQIRAASPKCPTCGKPTAGIIQARQTNRQTKEQAGLCVCKIPAVGGLREKAKEAK